MNTIGRLGVVGGMIAAATCGVLFAAEPAPKAPANARDAKTADANGSPAKPGDKQSAASGTAASDKKDKKANEDKPKQLFDGKSLDGWKESSFASQGRVEVKDGALVIGFGEGCSGVTYKGDFPTTNYELHLEAKRVDGDDFFATVTFPVQRKAEAGKKAQVDPCSLVVGGWGGGVVGLSSIDGSDASENSTSNFRDFKKGQWYDIRVRVTENKIEAWIDKDKVVDFTIGQHRLSIRIEVEPSKPLGIATWHTTGAIRKVELTRVDKSDTPAEKDE
jgi:hypothetical protein